MTTRTCLPIAFLFVLWTAPAAAQPNGGAQGAAALPESETWSAWLGCWRSPDEGPLPGMVCLFPGDEPTAVRIAHLRGGLVREEEELRAGGFPTSVAAGGCEGTETASRSGDGLRVYVRGELDCGPVRRISSRALTFVSDSEWIDVQSATVAGEHSVHTTRYREVPASEIPPTIAADLPAREGPAGQAIRLLASTPLDVERVIEAAGALEAPALEALLAARGAGFGIDGRDLRRLDAEAVPASVIDVMVALSYPDRFQVAEDRVASAPTRYASPWYRSANAYPGEYCFDGYLIRPGLALLCGFGTGYGRYGFSGYDPYFQGAGRPVIVIIEPDPQPKPAPARAVRGQGYTRGGAPTAGAARPRNDPPAGSVGGSTRTATAPSGASGSRSPSGGAAGSSTGRTAQPRPHE